MTTFSKQAELDFMHNFRHDTEGDRWAKHEIESLRAENMELKNNITICSVRIKELSQQVTLLREALRWRDVSVDGLPKEAQEILFIRDGKALYGAFIGGVFWYSNKQCAALYWKPMPDAQEALAATQPKEFT